MIKYFNYIFFIVLLGLFFLFNTNSKISTSLQTILPNSQNKELLQEFSKFESNKKIFLAIKRSDKKSLKKIKQLEKEFLKIPFLQKEQFKVNKEFESFKKKYQLYLNDMDNEKLKNIDVKNELIKLYESIINSFITININKSDPLSLLKKESIKLNIKNGRLVLDGYGYLSIFTIKNSINSLKQYEQIYDEIKKIEDKNSDIKTFSYIYYFVENSRYIKNDATNIVILASFFLIALYIIILRNIKLLINTLLTLGISALIATIILTNIYDEISIFVLVFGLSISTIAIDYMFHHYFHKNYEQKMGFNKEVFLGFFTTFVAFFILSFIDFLLIKQIAQFALISLFTSYIIFAFIYPYITFISKEFRVTLNGFDFLNTKFVFIISIIVLIFASQNLNFDFDIQSLDYDNKSLKQKELFFKNALSDKGMQTVIIKAKNINQLIYHNEQIKNIDLNSKSSLNNLISKESFLKKKQELSKLQLDKIKKDIDIFSKQIGFKSNSFNKAYKYDLQMPKYSYKQLIDYGISIQKYKDEYISYSLISKNKIDEVLKLNFVYAINLKTLFEKDLQKDLNKMIKLGILSLVFIVLIIIFITKNKMIDALNFLLLPSAFIFIYLSFIDINILHIFMFFIILAISIDYAIYSSKDNSIATKKAIMFSALSSFAGFGVLVFSSTPSLYSIGSVASLGVFTILILILLKKVQNES